MTRRRDDGLILPLVLVIVVVVGAVVVAIATYASATLRYGQVAEQSSDRLAAANGAMDNALEAIDRSASLCSLTTLANSGYTYSLLQPTAAVSTINGINPTVQCRTLGTAITGVEEYALVLTADPGDGTRTGAMLTVDGSTTPRKVVDGPVYMDRRPNVSDTLELDAPLTIQNGDLWYRRTSCPAPDVSVDSDLLISPAGYSIRCIPAPNWQALFGAARPTPNVPSAPVNPAPIPPGASGCTVFSPGKYTDDHPELGAYNYFKSGTYYFEDIGEWDIENEYVMFGWPGLSGPSIPGKGNDTIASNKCVAAWQADADRGGATIYLGGDSRIVIEANGAMEVSGRDQSGRFVAVQALDGTGGGIESEIQGDDPPGPLGLGTRLIEVDAGNNKQIAIRGLLWAPYASIEFNNVSNTAVAALTGGAVISEIFLQAPNSATNFLVTSGNTPGDRRLELTATATSPNGGVTRVRALIAYRNGDYALESRRVLCLTPNDPAAALC